MKHYERNKREYEEKVAEREKKKKNEKKEERSKRKAEEEEKKDDEEESKRRDTGESQEPGSMPGSSQDGKRDLSDHEEHGEEKRVRFEDDSAEMRESVVEIAEIWKKEIQEALGKESEEGCAFDYLLEEGAWDHVHGGISPGTW